MTIINNWEDWFNNCGSTSSQCEKYEELIAKYYDLHYSRKKSTINERQAAFEKRHRSKFYKDLPLIPTWKIKSSFIIGFLVFLIAFLINFAVVLFLSKSSILSSISNISIMNDMSIIEMLVFTFRNAIGLFIFITALLLFIFVLRTLLLRSKVNRLENKLKDTIQYIPPKYRNSTCTKYLYEIHKTNGLPYELAIESCDDYIRSNNLIANYMSIMFDEPMADMELETNSELLENSNFDNTIKFNINENNQEITPIENSWTSVENINVEIPNLPDDIKQHTFSGISNAETYLESMIGLDSIKDTVRKMKNRMSFYASEGDTQKISGNNMVFLGSPGTGKSTVARIITSILSEFGYIKNSYCVEIDGNYLKSVYTGQSAEITTAVIQYCEEIGACLFIDEAYTLLDNGSAGKEALTVLLQAMEQKKDSLVVIFAGYEDDINRLLASNQGFVSRIKYKLYFDDYDENELIQIFNQMIVTYANGAYDVENNALIKLKKHFTIEKLMPGFGNARVVRNALDKILDIHADRFMRQEIEPSHKFIIEEADVNKYIEERNNQLNEDKRNYLANNDLDSSIITIQDLKSHTKPGSTNPSAELESMIGLDTIKKEIKQLIAQYQFYNGEIENFGHCLFIGPSGTGKSTLAKILTGWLYNLGLISENRYFDCTGAYLQGSYTGHTGKRTEAICQYATGGVLFIDEAYSLVNSDGTASDYGAEAIAVLIDFMEKNRGNLVVIFAGYEKEMADFLNANTGIKSRITNTFHFENYTPYEMANIMNLYAHKDKFRIEQNCWEPIQYYLLDESKKPNFGNARDVRNLWDKIKKQHIYNYSQNMYDESKKYYITLNDINTIIKR